MQLCHVQMKCRWTEAGFTFAPSPFSVGKVHRAIMPQNKGLQRSRVVYQLSETHCQASRASYWSRFPKVPKCISPGWIDSGTPACIVYYTMAIAPISSRNVALFALTMSFKQFWKQRFSIENVPH